MFSRKPSRDPRTVARDVPGIFESIFPQLVPGIIAYLNRSATSDDAVERLPLRLFKASSLRPAMLFEIAYVRGEQLLDGMEEPDWDACLRFAAARQQRHFDAEIPKYLSRDDVAVAEWVGNSICTMIGRLVDRRSDGALTRTPKIPGCQWIASGVGDFSIGDIIIEVKCTNRNFSSADYRQVIIYWLLSYVHAVENDTVEWQKAILLNPRLNHMVEFSFNEIITLIGAGRSKLTILEQFLTSISDSALKLGADEASIWRHVGRY